MILKVALITFLLDIIQTIPPSDALRKVQLRRQILKSNDSRRYREGPMSFMSTHGAFRKSHSMTPYPQYLFNGLQETDSRKMASPIRMEKDEPNLSYDMDSDSDEELAKFKHELKMYWKAKQNEVELMNRPSGDVVNMVAASMIL